MDSLDSADLSSISVCDLNTKFNDRCHTDWSKTNLILVVTPNGIYILKPQLDNKDGLFQIDLISNPTTRFHHKTTRKYWPKFDALWQSLSNQQYMEVFSDPALLTNVENLSLTLYPRRYRQARWSPPIDCYPKECLMAVATLDYQLLIIQRVNNIWVVRADLSKSYDGIWSRICMSAGDIEGEVTNYEMIRKHILSLSFCCFCWKKSNCGSGPFLLAATVSGDIVIWQVALSRISPKFLQMNDLMHIKVVAQTYIEDITSMELHKELLIISSRDGQVLLYDLTSILKPFNQYVPPPLQSDSNGIDTARTTFSLLRISPNAVIWHKDNIEVTDLYVQPISSVEFKIVIAKSTNIFWSFNSYIKREDNSAATLAISSSFSAIDSLNPEISLNQSPATWLRPAGLNSSVLIANDGSFFRIQFMDDAQDTCPAFYAISTGSVNLSYMIPRGLCCSPNGHLILMIPCVNFLYDPCKLSAPSKLILVPTINEKRFFIECISHLKDVDWLRENQITSPMDVCDRIDYIRSVLILLNKQQLQELYKNLMDSVLKARVPEDDFELIRLKILGFLLMRLLAVAKHDNNANDEYQRTDLDTHVQDVIIRLKFRRLLNEMVEHCDQSPTENLEDRQKLSLINYTRWCKDVAGGDSPDSDAISRLRSKLGEDHETCPICEAEIPFESLRHGTCNNKHRFERCASSLLMIDPQKDDELECEHCNRHYLAEPIWISDSKWLCLFCQ